MNDVFRENVVRLTSSRQFRESRHVGPDRASFGNEVVELESELLRVRVIRDRGQVFLDVATLGTSNWVPLGRAVAAARGCGDEIEALVKPADDASPAQEMLTLHAELGRALGPDLAAFQARCSRIEKRLDAQLRERLKELQN